MYISKTFDLAKKIPFKSNPNTNRLAFNIEFILSTNIRKRVKDLLGPFLFNCCFEYPAVLRVVLCSTNTDSFSRYLPNLYRAILRSVPSM